MSITEAIVKFVVQGEAEVRGTVGRVDVDLTNLGRKATETERATAQAVAVTRAFANQAAIALGKVRETSEALSRLSAVLGSDRLARFLKIEEDSPTGLALLLGQSGARGVATGVQVGGVFGKGGAALGALAGGLLGIGLESAKLDTDRAKALKESQAKILADQVSAQEDAEQQRAKNEAQSLIEQAGGARLGAALNGQRSIR